MFSTIAERLSGLSSLSVSEIFSLLYGILALAVILTASHFIAKKIGLTTSANAERHHYVVETLAAYKEGTRSALDLTLAFERISLADVPELVRLTTMNLEPNATPMREYLTSALRLHTMTPVSPSKMRRLTDEFLRHNDRAHAARATF